MDIRRIAEEYGFSDAEQAFLRAAETPTTADMNQSRAVSNLMLTKTIDVSTNKIIKSNEKFAASNEKYSTRLVWLTGALVFVGLLQIVIEGIQIYLKR